MTNNGRVRTAFRASGMSPIGMSKPQEVRKRYFLKKEAKTFARLSPTTPRQPRKSFLVLFSKKNSFP
jgi:hypothetical protein